MFHAEWNREMAEWKARRDAFHLLREKKHSLWEQGNPDEALALAEKIDTLYPDFVKEEEEMNRERDALTTRVLRGEPLPQIPPSIPTDVWYDGRRWRARIRVNGETIFLGRFKTEGEAVSARDAAGSKYGVDQEYRVYRSS